MEGSERLRLFCALRLPSVAIDELAAWQARLPLPAGVRPMAPENLHVTLAFLGATPRARVGEVSDALRAAVRAVEPPVLAAEHYRETRSVGMVVFEDGEGRATTLAHDLFDRLERLGLYRPEKRPWLPHVTVVRFRERPRLSPVVPDLGQVAPSEATVTMSVLRPTGAQYADIESVALGG